VYLVQELRADNDPNGNGQWLHVVYHLGDDSSEGVVTVAVMPADAFAGVPHRAVESAGFQPAATLPAVHIGKADYHARVRQAKRNGVWRYADRYDRA
jgi:hypothetical protein